MSFTSYLLFMLLGLCLGFALAGLLASSKMRRPNLPGRVSQCDEHDPGYEAHDFTYHYDELRKQP